MPTSDNAVFADPNPGLVRRTSLTDIINVTDSASSINQIRGAALKGSVTYGIPSHVTNVGVSTLQASKGSTSTIRVTFHRDPSDKAYGETAIWVKGYQGNNNPVKVGSSNESPATVVLNNTGEPVSLIAQASGNVGQAPLASAPTTGIRLPLSAATGYGTDTVTSYTPGFPPPSTPTIGYGCFLGAKDLTPVDAAGSGSSMSQTGVANQVYGCELYLEAQYTITKVAMLVITASGTTQFGTAGIYDSTGNTKLIDAGANAFDLSTASQKYREVTLGTAVTLVPGKYLFVVGANGLTGGSVANHIQSIWYSDLVNGATLGTPTKSRFFTAANSLSGGALPSTLGALTGIVHATAVAMPAILFQT